MIKRTFIFIILAPFILSAWVPVSAEPPKALRLVDAGFVVVLFDPDGRGKSTGKEDFGGYIHQDGLAAVVRFTADLPYVDAQNMGLVTYSYGITMASGALARREYADQPKPMPAGGNIHYEMGEKGQGHIRTVLRRTGQGKEPDLSGSSGATQGGSESGSRG